MGTKDLMKLVQRLKNIDMSEVSAERKISFIVNEGRKHGATDTEINVLYKNVFIDQ